MSEEKDRLDTIVEIIDRTKAEGRDMLLSTKKILDVIHDVALGLPVGALEAMPQSDRKIVISVDASVKTNPGGPGAVGIVIDVPGAKDLMKFGQMVPAQTNNQAEYDAVYLALISFMGLFNRPAMEIEVRSDSQLVVRQINGEWECNDQTLLKKRDAIRELVAQIPVKVTFIWRPRNSTPELETANFIAQDYLGVPRH